MKQILLYILIASVLFGAFQLYNSQNSTQSQNDQTVNSFFSKKLLPTKTISDQKNKIVDTINQRNFFKQVKQISLDDQKLQESEQDIPQIITYGINFNLNLSQNVMSEDQEDANQNVKVNAQCDIQTIYDEEKNIFDIAVAYTFVERIYDQDQNNETFEDNQENGNIYVKDIQEDESEQIEVVQEQNKFFLIQVDADSGKVLNLKIESQGEEDELVTSITEQLVNDIFPDLRKESYKKGSVESDNLGTVQVEFKQEQIDENHILVNKSYDEEDYIKTENNLSIPESDYDRTVIVQKDTGLVVEGTSDYKFTLGDTNEDYNDQNLRQSDEVQADLDIEVLGKIQGQIKSKFWIVEKSERDTEIAKKMFQYRNTTPFQQRKLIQDQKATVNIGGDEQQSESNQQEETQEKLSATTFNETRQIAGTSVLGFSVGIDFIYSGSTDNSNIALKVKVQNKYMFTALSQDFSMCKPSSNLNTQTRSLTFFTAWYPIFGIVNIQVAAKGVITYGWNTTVQTQTRYCAFNFTPFFRAGLYAEGKVSAVLLSAGVYAKGNLLDTNLTLSAITQAGKSSLDLYGNFKAFSYEMGIKIEYPNCFGLREEQPDNLLSDFKFENDFKQVKQISQEKNTKLTWGWNPFKAIVNVVNKVIDVATSALKSICKTQQKEISLVRYSTGQSSYKIWGKSVPFGI